MKTCFHRGLSCLITLSAATPPHPLMSPGDSVTVVTTEPVSQFEDWTVQSYDGCCLAVNTDVVESNGPHSESSKHERAVFYVLLSWCEGSRGRVS